MNSPTRLEADAILFDLCGVIFDDTLWSRWLFQLVSRMGRLPSYAAFAEAWEQQFLRDVNHGRRDYWDALREFLASLGLRRGQIDEACLAGQARRRQFDESVRPLPGVKAGLAQLSAQGWTLGTICNGPFELATVKQKLAWMGLSPFFHAVLASRDLHHQAARRYQAAAAQLGVAVQRLVFVSANARELAEAAANEVHSMAWQLTGCTCGTPVSDFRDLLRLVDGGRVRSLAG